MLTTEPRLLSRVQIIVDILIVSFCYLSFAQSAERPYELVWVGRDHESIAPLVDFEDIEGWTVEAENTVAAVQISNERPLWGESVGKLVYRGTGPNPTVILRPPESIEVSTAFDAVSLWVYGNNFLGLDKSTPQLNISALFQDSQGHSMSVPLAFIRWEEWFLCHHRLSNEQIQRVSSGARLTGIEITGGNNTEDRVLYIDNLAVFKEEFAPLNFQSRPRRGVRIFPEREHGVNTGVDKLPFPNRKETIVPNPGPDGWITSCQKKQGSFIFNYFADDGALTVEIPTDGLLFDGIRMNWNGTEDWIYPCREGGLLIINSAGELVRGGRFELQNITVQKERIHGVWHVIAGKLAIPVEMTFWLHGKNLVIDLACEKGNVAEIRFGYVEGLSDPRLITLPYYTYGKKTRPAVIVSGSAADPLFFAAHLDWTLTNGSMLWAENHIDVNGVACNGGARYLPKTDGQRNPVYERLIFSLSPKFEEVLPNIPNPASPWLEETADKLWIAYASGNRQRNADLWRGMERYGIRELIVTDHIKQWADGYESYTLRTRFAPGKGGNEGQYKYTRIMRDELGYMYGPYNDFTDIGPTNCHWNYDMVARTADNQLQKGFVYCYGPKPARAVELAERIPPKIQQEMNFNAAYCDVHTAVEPWRRTDYDSRVPGAATLAATYYAYGEIMLLQKQAWEGPVYSEGGHHYVYSGLTDGNYAQDQSYFIPQKLPWLVDFDLLKMHNLENNFGMGNLHMFYGKGKLPSSSLEFDRAVDRFLAASMAFGHSGFLILSRGMNYTLRSYYMLQQIQARYTTARPEEIRYVDAEGCLHTTSQALSNGAYMRSQVAVRYDNGCFIVANGNKNERMQTVFHGRRINLPPNGYAGWTDNGDTEVFSGDVNGHRADYAVSKAYIFIDGRGKFIRFPKAAGSVIGICRILSGGGWEVIPYKNEECGFAVNASSAEALDKAGNVLGTAELRNARGLTYFRPVKEAFSYRLHPAAAESANDLSCSKTDLFPGESAVVTDGETQLRVTAPTDAEADTRLWYTLNGKWIDFTVRPICDLQASIEKSQLDLRLKSNFSTSVAAVVKFLNQDKRITLVPEQEVTIEFDLPQKARETLAEVPITVRAGDYSLETSIIAFVVRQIPEFTRFEPKYEKRGMVLPNGQVADNLKDYGATVHPASHPCDGMAELGLFLRGPLAKVESGFAYGLLKPVQLPSNQRSVFAAAIGRNDQCPEQDDIDFKLVVLHDDTETEIGEWSLARSGRQDIQCELTPWQGREIQLKLMTGSEEKRASSYNSFGCWLNMRIVGPEESLLWRLPKTVRPQFAPASPSCNDVSPELLSQAKKGWLHYQGQDLSEIEFELNGMKLDGMAKAVGDVMEDTWSSEVSVELSASAISSLGLHNLVRILNPRRDFFKIRNVRIELELPGGSRCSSLISADTYTQPGRWRFIAGIGVPLRENVEIDVWFQ